MTVTEYKERVKALFKEGGATDEQWEEMARAILDASEGDYETTAAIDAVCDPRRDNEEG